MIACLPKHMIVGSSWSVVKLHQVCANGSQNIKKKEWLLQDITSYETATVALAIAAHTGHIILLERYHIHGSFMEQRVNIKCAIKLTQY